MSGMIKVKVSELTGAALDYAVEIAIHDISPTAKHAFAWQYQNEERKDYSSNWSHGGPLIEKHDVCLAIVQGQWYAAFDPGYKLSEWDDAGSGDTPLLAACRAIVTEKLGETIQLPSRLLS